MRWLLLMSLSLMVSACQLPSGNEAGNTAMHYGDEQNHALPDMATLLEQLQLTGPRLQQIQTSPAPQSSYGQALFAAALSAPAATIPQRQRAQQLLAPLLAGADKKVTDPLYRHFFESLHDYNQQLLELAQQTNKAKAQKAKSERQLADLEHKLDALKAVEKELDPRR